MLSPLLIFATFFLLLVIFIKPKWGSFLVWFILFTYPHSLWAEFQLPMNIGADDLFCIVFFLIIVIRRNVMEQLPIRFGYSFWLLTSWVLIWTIASISGSRYSLSSYNIFYLKEIFKYYVYWGLFYSILHSIDDVDDLRRQFSMFTLAAFLGALLVVLSYFYPGPMAIFKDPGVLWKEGVQYESRAMGAFGNANMAAGVIVCFLTFLIASIRLQKSILSKILIYSFMFVMLMGVVVTKSRSGLMALVGTIFLMAFLSKHRKLAWLVIFAGIVVSFYAGEITEVYKERIAVAYNPETGQVGKNVAGRFYTWSEYFRTATTQIYLFGQGPIQGHLRNHGETHSAYVSLITVYGFGAIVWAIIGVFLYFKKIIATKRSFEPLLTVVADGCFWMIIAWGIYALSADAISSQYTRYILFYSIVLLDRAHSLSKAYNLSSLEAYNPSLLDDPDYVYEPGDVEHVQHY